MYDTKIEPVIGCPATHHTTKEQAPGLDITQKSASTKPWSSKVSGNIEVHRSAIKFHQNEGRRKSSCEFLSGFTHPP